MADKSLTERNEEKDIQSREETRASESYAKPSVNIIETENGLILLADLPGSTKESLDINVDKGVLTINAPVSRTMPGRAVYTEFEFAPYYRQFAIPDGLDQENTKADFANGLLTLNIPKSAAAKPRKIEIQSA